MDIKSGAGYPASALSNFAPHPFTFRGISVTSMEGFLQGLKFKNPEMQKHIFTLAGKKAKFAGKKKNWQRNQTLWFQGESIDRQSQEYQDLLDEAYNEMFTQNNGARKALLATSNATLTHAIGRNKPNATVLTKQEFTSRLMKIREELSQTGEDIDRIAATIDEG
jgi:predicted NAD-dependent protein-ADP-ribosyltransferase YbiA (DUF1768 family)